MKFVCISDTHLRISERSTPLPEGDVLIHAGDLLSHGSIEELVRAKVYLKEISPKFKHIIFVPGNHDRILETNEQLSRAVLGDIKNLIVLIDQSVEIDGVKIFGSPWQPEFCTWAFNLPRGEPLREKWKLIPQELDVLITHSPPYGILDETPRGEKVGCEDLLEAVRARKIKFHVFGHIHGQHGEKRVFDTFFINASTCSEMYNPIYEPIVFEVLQDG